MYAVRDRNGMVWAFEHKPERGVCAWLSTDGGMFFYIPGWVCENTTLKDLKWEDEPLEIDIIIQSMEHIKKEVKP